MMKTREEKIRERADRYLVCFGDSCPLHEHCLRWEAGQYVTGKSYLITSVNLRYEGCCTEKCELFRDNQPKKMPVGMKKRFYYDMPAHTATSIKKRLIAATCRSTYYSYHSGLRPITPEMQELIERTCREEGWNGPLLYDGEVEDLAWEKL